jgi:hypothetical protein
MQGDRDAAEPNEREAALERAEGRREYAELLRRQEEERRQINEQLRWRGEELRQTNETERSATEHGRETGEVERTDAEMRRRRHGRSPRRRGTPRNICARRLKRREPRPMVRESCWMSSKA